MTAKAPFTQASIQRAIRAAQLEGLRVIGVRPDGTVLVDDGEKPVERKASPESKWAGANQ